MRKTSIGALCCALLLLLGAYLSVGQNLRAEREASAAASLELTEHDFAPIILGQKRGPDISPTIPAPTTTPVATTPVATTPPTATPQQTVTATATAIATATPLPTAEPNAVVVRDNHSLWVDSLGRLNLRGEVENTGSQPVRAVRVEANFLNKKGRAIYTDEALVLLDRIGPGERACFTLSIDPPSKWKSYALGAVTYQPGPTTATGLTISEATGAPDEMLGWYRLGGKVSNATTQGFGLVRIVGTLYDANGVVVGCDFAYTFSPELAPGATDDFELFFADRDYADVANFSIAAEGETR